MDIFLPIDYQKLSRYFQIQLVIRILQDGSSKYIVTPFRRCTEEDFRDNGYVDEKIPLDLEKIVCPDTESVKDFYRIKNGY